MKTTGKIIAELRKEKGMSQEELADVLFVTRQAISKWESDAGSPGIDNLERIADYFNVTIDYLLGKKADGESPSETPEKAKQGSKREARKTADTKKKLGRALGILALVGIILLAVGFFVPYYSFGRLSVNLLELFFQRDFNAVALIIFDLGLAVGAAGYFVGGYKSAKSRYPKKPLLYLLGCGGLELFGIIFAIVGVALVKVSEDPAEFVEPNGAGPFMVMAGIVLIFGLGLANIVFTYLLSSGKVSEEKLFKAEE